MNIYDCILFDADNTLFSFDQDSALKQILSNHGVKHIDDAVLDYKTLNKQLWRRYEANAITLNELQADRFMPWSNHRREAITLNEKFLLTIATLSRPLTGAEFLLKQLKRTNHAKIGLISNGFTLLHQHRLKKTGFAQYFDHVVTSEDAGIAKPAPHIFKLALQRLGVDKTAKVLMVGDNINADIHGAAQLGFDTCWINKNNMPDKTTKPATLKANSLDELSELLICSGQMLPGSRTPQYTIR